MVAGGNTATGETNAVEIIDLETTQSKCPNFPVLPKIGYGQSGQFGYKNNPLVCGGSSANIYDKFVEINTSQWNLFFYFSFMH